MPKILTLATAALKSDSLDDTNHALYPRVDYIELQRLLDMDVLDYGVYNHGYWGRFFRYLETQLRSDLYLTMLALSVKHRYQLVFTMSERVGTPFAGFHAVMHDRKQLVSMFTCWSWRQEAVISALGLLSSMDAILVHCASMRRHIVELGAPSERVYMVPYSIDQRFFSPIKDIRQQPGFVMSVGETRSRDYATLFQAVDGLPIELLVARSGRWYAREKNHSLHEIVPTNVTVDGGLSQMELRKLYAESQFVVLPIYDSVYSAGATATLEAMCMGRAVIVTRSAGILDYVIDGETGILVDPGDVHMMRAAIQYLIAHPDQARRMGENARQRIEEELNIDIYVARVAQFLMTGAAKAGQSE